MWGPAKDAARIPFLDRQVREGDVARVGSLAARVIETPGHTLGHIAYHFDENQVAFCGDTLFSLGCGRVFETPYAVMWSSLAKLAALPGGTKVYCGHEYTQANGRFAVTVESDNPALQARVEEVAKLRADGRPTLPTTIAAELATNPFLRAEEPSVQAALGMSRRRSRGSVRRNSHPQGPFLKPLSSSWLDVSHDFEPLLHVRELSAQFVDVAPRNSPSSAGASGGGLRADERREHGQRLIESGEVLPGHFLEAPKEPAENASGRRRGSPPRASSAARR